MSAVLIPHIVDVHMVRIVDWVRDQKMTTRQFALDYPRIQPQLGYVSYSNSRSILDVCMVFASGNIET